MTSAFQDIVPMAAKAKHNTSSATMEGLSGALAPRRCILLTFTLTLNKVMLSANRQC
jgi:hypothetical protein